ncbi:L,D-transpeptidase [Sagittula salina]|uniref:L,D-transpeptidase n=1 Tax=Sagittula salina TaxID=2820268 RepID=A0A940MKI6_9RHOB|nr:L,D-transpeptidase [Sagittula salina]MBP0483191.1 L,D-transpeptidase [Sagittula salina]
MTLKPMAIGALAGVALLAACATPPVDAVQKTAAPVAPAPAGTDPLYGAVQDAGRTIAAIPEAALSERNRRQVVDYWTDEPPGTIIVDPYARFLYLVLENDRALRYGVAVGEQGRGFSGEGVIPFKREWPRWTPTQNMLRRDPELYGPVRNGMEGGLDNPLGARALYLFKGGRDRLYRIHGTNNPFSIGKAVSSGCIRLFNQDILDLHERVKDGARVVVLSESESGKGTTPAGRTTTSNQTQ